MLDLLSKMSFRVVLFYLNWFILIERQLCLGISQNKYYSFLVLQKKVERNSSWNNSRYVDYDTVNL